MTTRFGENWAGRMVNRSAVVGLYQELRADPRSWYLFNYATSISLANRYVYVETPKVACTSIKATLMSLELSEVCTDYLRPSDGGLEFVLFPYGRENAPDRVGVHHPPISSPFVKPYQLDLGEFLKVFESESYFRFAFVRNPFSRVLSAFLDKVSRDSPERRSVNNLLGTHVEHQPSFKEFVAAISLQSVDDMDPHWRPQTYCLRTDQISYSFVGKFETFESDMRRVDREMSGVLAPHFNKVCPHETKAALKIGDYYCEEIEAMVRQIYRSDFDFFGYVDNFSC